MLNYFLNEIDIFFINFALFLPLTFCQNVLRIENTSSTYVYSTCYMYVWKIKIDFIFADYYEVCFKSHCQLSMASKCAHQRLQWNISIKLLFRLYRHIYIRMHVCGYIRAQIKITNVYIARFTFVRALTLFVPLKYCRTGRSCFSGSFSRLVLFSHDRNSIRFPTPPLAFLSLTSPHLLELRGKFDRILRFPSTLTYLMVSSCLFPTIQQSRKKQQTRHFTLNLRS